MPKAAQTLRVLIFGPAAAFYVALAAWSYSAAIAGDVVIAAITMFLAWLVGATALVLSEQFAVFEKYKRAYVNLAGCSALAALSVIVFSIFYQHRPPLPYVEGARLVIKPDTPLKLDDGNFYFPVSICDIGDRPVEAFSARFYQESSKSQFDADQENGFMATTENMMVHWMLANGIVGQENFGTGSDITLKTCHSLTNPKAEVSPPQMDEMRSGKYFLYSGVVVVFADENSRQDNVLYYAESCLFYDHHVGRFSNCPAHNNVTKDVYDPSKFHLERYFPSQSLLTMPEKNAPTWWSAPTYLQYSP